MSTSDSCKDSASKSSNDGVCEMNNKLQNMSTADNNSVSICANCGKEGDDVDNICNKCKQVKYCNAACKKKHRHKHKKACERRVAELHDEKLFKQPPPNDDCPICFLTMPSLGSVYYNCCGKVICNGCNHAPVYDNQGNEVAGKKCPFCRTPEPTTKELQERYKKRVEAKDAAAMYNLGNNYYNGTNGYLQDHTKALELWKQAGELGYSEAYCNIGYVYINGRGVEIDKKKAEHYWELAAIGGSVLARYNLGIYEEDLGNMERALKHYIIAVRGGYAKSLEKIKQLYSNGHASKDNYTKALRLYQVYLGEIKSRQRDEATAAEGYPYY